MQEYQIYAPFFSSHYLNNPDLISRVSFIENLSNISIDVDKLSLFYIPFDEELSFEHKMHLSNLPDIEENKLRIIIFYGESIKSYQQFLVEFNNLFPRKFDSFAVLPSSNEKQFKTLHHSPLFFLRIFLYKQLVNIDFEDLLGFFKNSRIFFWLMEEDIFSPKIPDIAKTLKIQFFDQFSLLCSFCQERYHNQKYDIDSAVFDVQEAFHEILFSKDYKLTMKIVEEMIYHTSLYMGDKYKAVFSTGYIAQEIPGYQIFLRL